MMLGFMKNAVWALLSRTTGIILFNRRHRLLFFIKTRNDRHVYTEIFSKIDAYRLEVVKELIKAGTVVDIGAHKGLFTCFAARYAERVIAFEPDPANFRFLSRNIRINRLHNVSLYNEAVSDEEGIQNFIVSDRSTASHTFYPSAHTGQGREIAVTCKSIDQVIRAHGLKKISVLKMDCEGSEYDILYQISDRSLASIDTLLIEIHESPTIPHKKDELVDCLKRRHFEVREYDHRTFGDQEVWMVFCRNSSR